MKRIVLIAAIVALGTLLAKSEGKDKVTSTANSTEVSATVISINGKVTDKETGEALAGALVHIDDTNLSAYSDFEGSFTFNNLKPGNYTATVTFISYEKSMVEINALSQKDITVELSSIAVK